MINKLTNIIQKYLGKIEYLVTIINNGGEIQQHIFYNIKKVNEFVDEINLENYWNVKSIAKIRRCHFKYNHQIIHSPLWFQLEKVTETEYVENHDYSFILKDTSLTNIKRVSSKEFLN